MENETNIILKSNVKGPNYIDLSIKNFALGLVTLTLYRFWGKTAVRKRVWGETFLNNEPFEYTGTGGELLKGFLISLVVFVLPYLLLIFAIQLLPPEFAGLIAIPFILFVYLVIGAAIWLKIRYMASRTVWRGIRFGLHGKPMEFSISFFGQLLLSGITLGWYSPKMSINISEKIFSGLTFGDKTFTFDKTKAQGENLYGLFAIYWLSFIVGYAVLIAMLMSFVKGNIGAADAQDPLLMIEFMSKLYGAFILFILVVTFASLPFHAALERAIFKCLSIDNVNFRSEIKAVPLFYQIFVNMLLIVFSLGILTPVVMARNARFIINNLKAEGHLDFDSINQGEKGPSHGEGLTDALDMDISII